MKIKLFFAYPLLISLFFTTDVQGQGASYSAAGGLRLGYPFSVSLKKFVSEDDAFEVYLGVRNYGAGYSWVNTSGAYLKHFPVEDVDNLYWYVGGGASLYFFSFKSSYSGVNASTTVLGLQGYIGLDYRIPDSQVNLSVDWIPSYFFTGIDSGIGVGYGGLAVRYIFDD